VATCDEVTASQIAGFDEKPLRGTKSQFCFGIKYLSLSHMAENDILSSLGARFENQVGEEEDLKRYSNDSQASVPNIEGVQKNKIVSGRSGTHGKNKKTTLGRRFSWGATETFARDEKSRRKRGWQLPQVKGSHLWHPTATW